MKIETNHCGDTGTRSVRRRDLLCTHGPFVPDAQRLINDRGRGAITCRSVRTFDRHTRQ